MPYNKSMKPTSSTCPRIMRAAAFVLCLSCLMPALIQAKEKDPAKKYKQIISTILDFTQQKFVDDIDAKALYQGAMRGMLEATGDPHTVYLDEDDMHAMQNTTTGSFGGVGLTVSKDTPRTPGEKAYILVISPIENSPGEQAGIIAGDRITAINGEPTDSMTIDQAVAKIHGKIKTPVELTILRGGVNTAPLEFKRTLIRSNIEVPTVASAMIGKTGYLRIIKFTPDTAERTKSALKEFKRQGYDSLVIDLRNNPGGLISAAADVADLFIDSGTIFYTLDRNGKKDDMFTTKARRTLVPAELPVAVLINRGTASAAEIVSAALKDHHRAYLIGEKSYGKGSVQLVVPLSAGDGLKITIARYYTPSDACIDKTGILPDKEVLFPQLTEEAARLYEELLEKDVIGVYVQDHPAMTESDIRAYADELQKTYDLEPRLLRHTVRSQAMRLRGGLTYDLDYDVQLTAALSLVHQPNYAGLTAAAKTLKAQEQTQAQ